MVEVQIGNLACEGLRFHQAGVGVLGGVAGDGGGLADFRTDTLEDRWILSRFARTAAGVRSAVLAAPLRLPKYTVTPRPRSRWYSTVSTSPSRTLTDNPWFTEASTSHCVAPWRRASSSARPATSASGRVAEISLVDMGRGIARWACADFSA